ncbi:MAG: MIP family channel protein [Flavobacteriales bacterium]|nr:MIP family channel protein [Flavobacteriales bacterium]
MENRRYFSEFIGTFALVFCGTGAIIINQESGGMITHVGVALTFGLVVAAMIFTLGDVSGAHLNPAVTLSFAVAKRFPFKQVVPYVFAQVLGAFAASGILKVCFPQNEWLGATLPAGSDWQSFLFEVILTMILVLVIFNVTTGAKEKGITAAIAIGSVVGLEALFAGPVCGASMNPVRSLSPALVSGHLEHLWIYLTAPFVGAILGIAIHQFLFPTHD